MRDLIAKPKPHLIDVHVGGRIRFRRKLAGMTQEQLARALRLTFQQVQKYERGFNRVSASRLYEIARALGTDPSFFFQGLADPAEQADVVLPEEAELRQFFATDDGIELAKLFPKIAEGRLRRQVLLLVRALAE